MFLQLLRAVKLFSALQASDLVPLGALAAPAARVLFVLLEFSLTGKLSQTCHAVNALRFTPVLAIQRCQAEVGVASHTGVRQEAEVREAVFQESVLLGEGLRAVCAFKTAAAQLPPVAHKRFRRGEFAAADFTHNVQHTFV